MIVGCRKNPMNVRDDVLNNTYIPFPVQDDQLEREKCKQINRKYLPLNFLQ